MNTSPGNVREKWRGAGEREREVRGREGAVLILPSAPRGSGDSISCPLFIQAHGRVQAQRALPVFASFFQCVPAEPKLPCGMLTMPLTLLSFGLFSTFVVVSQDHVLGPFHLFSEMIIFKACYVKSYDIAHNTQALSNGPPQSILVHMRQGPSGLMSVLLSGMTMRRHLQGLSTENRKGEISEVNMKFVCDLAYALLENKYLLFFLVNNLYVTYF